MTHYVDLERTSCYILNYFGPVCFPETVVFLHVTVKEVNTTSQRLMNYIVMVN